MHNLFQCNVQQFFGPLDLRIYVIKDYVIKEDYIFKSDNEKE